MQAEAFENNHRAAEKMEQRFASKQVYVHRGLKGKIGKQPLSQPKVVLGRIIKRNKDGTKLKIETEEK